MWTEVYEDTCQASGIAPDLNRRDAILTLMEGEGISNYNSLELSGSHYLLFDKGNYRSEGELAQLSSEERSNRLRDVEVKAIFSFVKDKAPLQVIDLSSNDIKDAGARHVVQYLQGNSTLVALALKSNELGEEACRLLSSAIKFNRALKVLDLSHNNLGREGAKHIAELLETNEGLDDLDITRTGVDMPGIAAICATMRRNSTLQTLRMGDTVPFQSVEAEMGSHLGRMLQFNSSLKSLDISKIKLRDEGLEVLCQAMVKYNRSLTSLTLSGNKISMEGAKALGELLSAGTVLAHLNVSSNRLCDEGALTLANSLQFNSGLESLDVSSCSIDDEGLSGLADVLSRTSLYRFHAWGNSFGENAAAKFADLLDGHPYLKDLDFIMTKVDNQFRVAQAAAP